jgi:mRNA-degrading endonuclease RelE of RelBE toxin-antitoxin system
MTYRIVITEHFKKQIKRLKKKDRFIKEKLIEGLTGFSKSQAVHIGKAVYKFRLSTSEKGKSAGYRVYVFIVETNGILAPICIYATNEMENISLSALTLHLESVKAEVEFLNGGY